MPGRDHNKGRTARRKERKKEMIASVDAADTPAAGDGEPQPAKPRRGRPPGSKTRKPDTMSASDLQGLLTSAHKGILEVAASIMKRDSSGGELDGPSKALGELSSKALVSMTDTDELDGKTALWIYGAVAVLSVVSIFSLPRKETDERKKADHAVNGPLDAGGAVPFAGNA